MCRFLSTLWRSGKNKPEVRRKCRRARDESGIPVSRTAHEESRLSRSANGRFWYNRWTKSPCAAGQSGGLTGRFRTGLAGRAREAGRGDTQTMHSAAEHDPTKHPLVRITTLGEFAL